MTTVDSAPDKTQFNRLSSREWINAGPGIVVINALPDGQLELYLWHFGQRLSFRPETPEALWNWCQSYAQDHWETMLSMGFAPPEEKTSIDPSKERRQKISITELDLEELFK